MTTRSRFQLHVITDGRRQVEELQAIVSKAVQGGADVVQLRYKSAPALDLYHLGQAIHPILQKGSAKLLINDRLDVALALEAVGVHLAAKSLPIATARTIAQQSPSTRLVGCSVHSVEEALLAEAQGADYITYGHIFRTNSKPGLAPRGVDLLRQVVDAVQIPVLAIGGITRENLDEVLAVGVAGIAVIGAVMEDQDPERATCELREIMDASPFKPRFALQAAQGFGQEASTK